jgi:transcriptional regulator with XRE-family HTH domain
MKTTTTKSRLREIRERKGLKQVELAARAGVSLATVNKAECWGFRLSQPTAARLATALGCNVGDLLPNITGED